MKTRPGFTLAELLLAVIIFSFMMTSLATIYSTANRNMFQNYRANIVKTNVGIAMRAIQNTLVGATRLDTPIYGASGNILAFATNVDQNTGCYPVNTDASSSRLIQGVYLSAASPPAWHYFCVAQDATTPGVTALYYHTGLIPLGPPGTGCDSATPAIWDRNGANGYPAFCGFEGGGTVTLLMQIKDNSAPVVIPPLFSRSNADNVYEKDLVLVRLRSYWSASSRGFGKSQRDVDFSLASAVKASIPVQ